MIDSQLVTYMFRYPYLYALSIFLLTHSRVCSAVEQLDYEIIAVYPRGGDDFTQGLVFYKGHLVESTGLYGKSKAQVVSWPSMTKKIVKPLQKHYFGEGITECNNSFFQLTWRSGDVLVRNQELDLISKKSIAPYQGWGITTFRGALVLSDGSSNLFFRNPETLELRKKVSVRYKGRPLARINELEAYRHLVVANVWTSNRLFFIEPLQGRVVAHLDFSEFVPQCCKNSHEFVFNGIAYHKGRDTFVVTGKNWDRVFEVRVFSDSLFD